MTHASYGIVQPNIEPPSHTFPPRMTFPSVGNGSVLLVLPQFVEVLGKKIDKISDEVDRKHAAFSSLCKPCSCPCHKFCGRIE